MVEVIYHKLVVMFRRDEAMSGQCTKEKIEGCVTRELEKNCHSVCFQTLKGLLRDNLRKSKEPE